MKSLLSFCWWYVAATTPVDFALFDSVDCSVVLLHFCLDTEIHGKPVFIFVFLSVILVWDWVGIKQRRQSRFTLEPGFPVFSVVKVPVFSFFTPQRFALAINITCPFVVFAWIAVFLYCFKLFKLLLLFVKFLLFYLFFFAARFIATAIFFGTFFIIFWFVFFFISISYFHLLFYVIWQICSKLFDNFVIWTPFGKFLLKNKCSFVVGFLEVH